MKHVELSDAELRTVKAALRFWRNNAGPGEREWDVTATDNGRVTALTDAELAILEARLLVK